MNLRDRRRRHLLLTLLVIEFLDIPGGQLLKDNLPQRWKQILHHRLLVGLIGPLTNAGLYLILEPVQQKHFHRFASGCRQCSNEARMLGLLKRQDGFRLALAVKVFSLPCSKSKSNNPLALLATINRSFAIGAFSHRMVLLKKRLCVQNRQIFLRSS